MGVRGPWGRHRPVLRMPHVLARPRKETTRERLSTMIYLIIQLCAVAFCLLCSRSLRRHAVWYYVGAFAVTALFFYGEFFGLPEPIWRPLFYAIDQCMLGTALFVVVMVIGALPRTSWFAQRLRPVRGELSIFAWILCLGHLVYLTIIPRMVHIALTLQFAMPLTVIGLVVSLILLVLLIVLGVTSFKFVKRRMSAKTWKAVQRWSYLFYALVYAHLMLMLAPTIATGAPRAILTGAVYSVIFVGYAVLRVRRARLDASPAAEKLPCDDAELAGVVA